MTTNPKVETSVEKRVFILGAGFSRPAGYPLATELTDEVLDSLRSLTGPDYELFELADAIRDIHGWIAASSSLPAINIEEFYSYASIYAERFRLEHHREPIGRQYGETAFEKGSAIETWLSHMDDALLDVLLEHDKNAKLAPIQRMVDILGPDDAVVTFNYDRLIERCLAARGYQANLGFEPSKTRQPSVLKLHGSMDWICLPRGHVPNPRALRRLYSKTDLNRERLTQASAWSGEDEYDFELFHFHDESALWKQIEGRDLIQVVPHKWALAGLGPDKRVSLVPGLGEVWENARNALFHADVIAIVGFSFSSFDRFAQIEFARVMAGRERQGRAPRRIVLIDPVLKGCSGSRDHHGHDLLRRVQGVFRPLEPIGLHHEEFDWQSL